VREAEPASEGGRYHGRKNSKQGKKITQKLRGHRGIAEDFAAVGGEREHVKNKEWA
jgi:hypothetical protein